MVRLAAVAVLIAIACRNEADARSTRLMSMHEAMQKTTVQSAVALLFKKHQHKQGVHSKKLVSLIQANFAQRKGMLRSERVVSRHGSGEETTTAPPTGYAAVSGATEMLNDMIEETMDKLTLEERKCRDFNRSTLIELGDLRAGVATFNSQANAARSRVLDATSKITIFTTGQKESEEQLKQHLVDCRDQLAALNEQLKIVTGDAEVMQVILGITDCNDTSTSFLQMDAQTSASSTALVSCRHCNKGRGMVMLQNSKLQQMLYKLRSTVAHNSLNQNLQLGFQEASEKFKPVALTEVAATHMRRLAGEARLHHRAQRNVELNLTNLTDIMNDSDAVNISQIPDEPVPFDCQPTDKCTFIVPGNCDALKDRFLLVAAGIEDKKIQLTRELADLEDFCEKREKEIKELLKYYEGEIAKQQEKLASATSDQNDAESGSQMKAKQFDTTSDEYGEEMGKCCDNQNDLLSERCALTKIRGELEQLNGTTVFITDCEVSDWSYGPCDKSCDGGQLKMTRSVLVHPNLGTSCPILEDLEACNIQPCPVDCVVEEWSGWSGCSAECDGGVRSRQRFVQVNPSNGGEECGDLTETEPCNLQSCNKDCVLAAWSEWTGCSKYCDHGHSRRFREVQEPAVGNGWCPMPESEGRLQFRTCNDVECMDLMPNPYSLMKCTDNVDIIVLLDGSGSLGDHGWRMSKYFAHFLIGSLDGGEDRVRVALMLFSGPRYWSDYYKCIGSKPGEPVDMEKDCYIEWVKDFTNNTAEVSRMAANLNWPRSSTLTSVALAEAQAMLVNGREEARSLVIVITDGRPISDERTRAAAMELKKHADVLWVPVGNYAPMDLIEEMASLPKKDHVVEVDSFSQLLTAKKINAVLASSCGLNVEIPGEVAL